MCSQVWRIPAAATVKVETSSSARQRCQMADLSPPEFENSGGFESRLTGKKYFWRVLNFWRISGGFDQFCTGLFLSGASGGILAVLEYPLAKSNIVITLSGRFDQFCTADSGGFLHHIWRI
jgi:hypothetical protein